MAAKGLHTLVEALVNLKGQGIEIQGYLAGDTFPGWAIENNLEKLLFEKMDLTGVRFTGQLNKASLARFFRFITFVCFRQYIQKHLASWVQKQWQAD